MFRACFLTCCHHQRKNTFCNGHSKMFIFMCACALFVPALTCVTMHKCNCLHMFTRVKTCVCERVHVWIKERGSWKRVMSAGWDTLKSRSRCQTAERVFLSSLALMEVTQCCRIFLLGYNKKYIFSNLHIKEEYGDS